VSKASQEALTLQQKLVGEKQKNQTLEATQSLLTAQVAASQQTIMAKDQSIAVLNQQLQALEAAMAKAQHDAVKEQPAHSTTEFVSTVLSQCATTIGAAEPYVATQKTLVVDDSVSSCPTTTGPVTLLGCSIKTHEPDSVPSPRKQLIAVRRPAIQFLGVMVVVLMGITVVYHRSQAEPKVVDEGPKPHGWLVLVALSIVAVTVIGCLILCVRKWNVAKKQALSTPTRPTDAPPVHAALVRASVGISAGEPGVDTEGLSVSPVSAVSAAALAPPVQATGATVASTSQPTEGLQTNNDVNPQAVPAS